MGPFFKKLTGELALRRGVGVATVLTVAVASISPASCQDPGKPTQLHGQVHLTLIHTSDIHSRLFPYNLQIPQTDATLGLGTENTVQDVGGIARMSYVVGRERARAGRVLHIDGGDVFQGAPIFNFYSGEAEMRALSAMGTDVMVVANHEFDRGARNLGTQIEKWATFPVLAANYRLEDPSQPGASQLASVIKPFTVLDADGLRVGVIGFGNLSSLTSIFDSPNRLGITPLNTTQVAQAYLDLLRPRVDVIVGVSHLGLDYDERMIESTTGFDVVLGGHNHIVLQPPKHVQDCTKFQDAQGQNYIEVIDEKTGSKERRNCTPRDVVLAHSGAFAKYVGRLDLVLSDEPADLPQGYEKLNGFEVLTSDYKLFPINATTPEDPVETQLLEPYHQGLDAMANLELLVGYGPRGSVRVGKSGGDSELGNMISTAMWLRLGIQTDFSLTNSTGIRADLVPGPVTVEEMYNIFPFDNAITKMQLSGVEVQQLFDFVARRSSGRGCVSQAQIAGVRVVINCSQQGADPTLGPGVATNIYIGAATQNGKIVHCMSDDDCPGKHLGQCDTDAGVCWQPIDRFGYYELATSDYLAGGGSGFRVLQRNTTQLNTYVQQRDALIDYMRQGKPCGASQKTKALRSCSLDADCLCDANGDPSLCDVGDGSYVCACPEGVTDNDTCDSNGVSCKSKGSCVLRTCRSDVADFQRHTCDSAPSDAVKQSCEKAIAPCSAAGEQCKFLACVDHDLGNFTDNRLRMVVQ
jgi:5'-nucleotidase/UDP-sugar diphosphatase